MKAIAACLSVFWAGQVLACAPDSGFQEMVGKVDGQPDVYISFSAMPLSQPFGLELYLCGDYLDAITRVDVAAIMPAHQHGMNYSPRVEPLGQGAFGVSGMVFHMPGTWEIRVSVFGASDPRFYSLRVDVP